MTAQTRIAAASEKTFGADISNDRLLRAIGDLVRDHGFSRQYVQRLRAEARRYRQERDEAIGEVARLKAKLDAL